MPSPQLPSQFTKASAAKPAAKQDFESQVRSRIDTMAYLPTTAAVAMKFIELGKDPEASPAEYVKVISSDVSLSTKLLALANSSWFGVRNRVTKIQVAVNLLGLGTVRTLAISYCLTGLHNELKLTAQESRIFWSASLCKAVAAKQLAAGIDPRAGEEAFAAGLFQDFALPIMYSVARDKFLSLIQDPSVDSQTRLQKERELFRFDHAELARTVALKLELPEVFVDAVAFHHNLPSLREFTASAAMAQAVYGAGLFPHVLEVWNTKDAQDLKQHLASQAAPVDSIEFMESVQKEFDQLYKYFENGSTPEIRLVDALSMACREAADSATRLVGTVHELLNAAASAGQQVHNLLKNHDTLQEAALRDALTGAMNREGFTAAANQALEDAAKYGSGVAVAFVDLDRFKAVNDAQGHTAGDAALRHAAACIHQHLKREDLLGRFGGDEFVVLIKDCTDVAVAQTVSKILQSIAGPAIPAPTGLGQAPAPHITASLGVVYLPPQTPAQSLDALITAADALMYQAKRAGGNKAHASRVRPKVADKVA
jgi:two-component system, cell cycle response regulator